MGQQSPFLRYNIFLSDIIHNNIIIEKNNLPSESGLLIVKYGLYYTPFLGFGEAKVTGRNLH
jgi:hypothetical protein